MNFGTATDRYSKKEKLLFHLVENFDNQYRSKFPYRRRLLLLAQNEHNVEKVVCTTIKPTKSKYSELFHVDKCAKFVADYVTYQQLSNPLVLPTQLKSPAYVLRAQIGTCFELSTLLVSLLIGNGHDAYVVSGFATKQCCENDQTYTKCPQYLDNEFSEFIVNDNSNKINTFDQDDFETSKFWKMMDQRKRDAENEKLRISAEQERLRILKLEEIPPDHLYGNRIHSWVLLIHDESIKFIEPTTGIVCDQFNDRYLTIESVWNHENYYVNMKPNVTARELSFNLHDLENWEHLLAAEPWSVYSEALKFERKNDILALKHFRMIPSWVEKLEIPENKFEEKFPHGHKTVYYRKTKHERYSKSHNSSGMICCITKYNDYACSEPERIAKLFHERKDKLKKSIFYLCNGEVIEEFDYGRKDTLKRLAYMKNQKPYWNNLRMEFYDIDRLDNLTSLQATNSKLQMNFRNRLDHLLSYTVYLNTQTVPENMKNIKDSIIKIVEKFVKTETQDNVDTREYASDEILLTYHYKDDEIFQKKQRYRRSPCLPCETRLSLHCECKSETKFSNKKHQIVYLQLLEMEKNSINDVWKILNEIHEIQEIRQSERTFE